jgi:hypothetical protein
VATAPPVAPATPVAPAAPVVTAPAAPAAPATPVYSPVPAMTPAPPAESGPVYSTTPTTDSPENQKLRETLDKKMQENEIASQQPTKPGKPTTTKKSATPEMPIMSLPQLSGPPSSLSPAKQQKLNELLQQYRADQLTPEQYHEQRAKVLSEP